MLGVGSIGTVGAFSPPALALRHSTMRRGSLYMYSMYCLDIDPVASPSHRVHRVLALSAF